MMWQILYCMHLNLAYSLLTKELLYALVHVQKYRNGFSCVNSCMDESKILIL